MATSWKYLPILKWKQGERIALQHLSAAQWDGVVPLLELLAVVATPDGAGLRAALPAYLAKIAKHLVNTLPEDKPIVVDVRYVAAAYPKPVNLLRVVCIQLAKLTGRQVIPVLTDFMVAQQASDLHLMAGFDEYILRIMTGFTDAGPIPELVKLVVQQGIPKSRLHLVIDQYSIVNEDPKVRLASVKPYLDAALAAGCASTTMAGGSFPVNLMGMGQGTRDLARVEWLMWKDLRKAAAYQAVRYGDYTVSNPAPIPDMDPKMVNPSVAIRYASDGFWRLFKAGGFKKGKPNQYQSLCTLLLGDGVYSGAAFSFGDDCYDKAANAKLGNGNPSSWRRDATSHHLVLTAAAL